MFMQTTTKAGPGGGTDGWFSGDAEVGTDRLAAISSCWEAKHNVCRRAGGEPLAGLVDNLCGRLSHWVDELGEAAEECSGLLLLRGTGSTRAAPHGPSATMDVVVLLVVCRKRPKVQIFAKCSGDGADDNFTCPPGPVPFHVHLRSCPSRICSNVVGLDWCTSDELALEMARFRSEWLLVPLVWVESPGTPSLLTFCVVGRGPPVTHRVRRPRPKPPANVALLALDVLEGAAMPEGDAQGAAMPEDDVDADDNPFAGVPADFV